MPLSRRAFLKLGTAALFSGLIPRPRRSPLAGDPPKWRTGVPLGRVTESRIRLYSRPNPEGKDIAFKYRHDVVTVTREVVGKGFYPHNHVWFETPEGYAYSSWVQPVRYTPNEPLPVVPSEGMYVEVSVPFTDAHAQPDPQSPIVYRLYYGTTYQISRREVAADGSVWYRLNDENVVKMYGQAAHFRPIAPEEFALLSLGVSDKLIVVTLSEQSLSAYEGKAEVFRARISSGRNYFGPDGATPALSEAEGVGSLTPAGEHPLWQKRASRHMTGGRRENGFDLPGVPWVSYFSSNGAALHGTPKVAQRLRHAQIGRLHPPSASGHRMPSGCSAGRCQRYPTCQATLQ